MKKFSFIDLFAGIGGFHQALASLGGELVFASEIDEDCVITYEKNFHHTVYGDIRDNIDKIPKFDVLAAGFPCQPFSKAGKRKGFLDENRGDLFYVIIEILKKHPECKFIIMENVRNLGDNRDNWEIIQNELKKLNFFITEKPLILSPSDFGIPQNRDRVYILGIRKDIRNEMKLTNGYIHLEELKINNEFQKVNMGDAFKILENNIKNINDYILDDKHLNVLLAWQNFKDNIFNTNTFSPVWIDYFGIGIEDFYTDPRIQFSLMPDWKKNIVKKNREFYLKNKNEIDKWYAKYDSVLDIKTFRKFEWNCGNSYHSIKDGIIQFRQSGLRVKKPDTFPSLVAIVNTPVIWDTKINNFRYITIKESATLQSFNSKFNFVGDKSTIYKQLGNSVNVTIIKILMNRLLDFAHEDWKSKE